MYIVTNVTTNHMQLSANIDQSDIVVLLLVQANLVLCIKINKKWIIIYSEY